VTAPAIELIDVHAGYGRIEVLHGVTFTVPTGSLFALLGPNGAGKTTTLKLIDGLHQPTGGCVHIAGRHVNGMAADKLARAHVCSIPEGRGIFPNLTVEENLRLVNLSQRHLSQSDIEARVFTRFPILGERRKQYAGTLSGGQQQMLALSRAVAVDPALLLVDELSMGLAPLVVAELYDTLGQLAAGGMTILIVEQFAHAVLSMADYAAVMIHGTIRAMGEPADVEDALGAYLGGVA
jgi:branched-chain amino acid transport system ATP-binding protein